VARIEPISKYEEYTLDGFQDWLKTGSIAEIKRMGRTFHIAVSLQEFQKERQDGNFKQTTVLVDNLARKKIKNVKFAGRIEFRDNTAFSTGDADAKPVLNIARETLDMLNALSPVGQPGIAEYKSNHFMFANGWQQGASANPPLDNPTDTIMFVNRMPYAKRLEGIEQPVQAKIGASIKRSINAHNKKTRAERAFGPSQSKFRVPTPQEQAVIKAHGKYTEASKKYMSRKAPNGIYTTVAKRLRRKYRGRVLVSFKYITMSQFIGTPYGATKGRTGARGGDRGKIRGGYINSSGPMLFPAIIIALDNNDGKFDGLVTN